MDMPDDIADSKENGFGYVVPSMADLSMAELRSRLTILGEVRASHARVVCC